MSFSVGFDSEGEKKGIKEGMLIGYGFAAVTVMVVFAWSLESLLALLGGIAVGYAVGQIVNFKKVKE